MNEYMSQFEKYSSLEAYKVAAMAKEKGLVLLEGDFNTYSAIPDRPYYEHDPGRKGYAIVKVVLGLYLTLNEDGSVFQDTVVDRYQGCFDTVWFRYSLEQAKEQILNFDGTIKNPPNFYAFVRQYLEEPEYYGYLQRFFLDEFAHKHGIVFKEKIMYIGGQHNVWVFNDDEYELDDILDCCKESFSKITKNDFLLVTDISRLNHNLHAWSRLCHVVPVAYFDTSCTTYVYRGRVQQEGEEMLDDEDDEPMEQGNDNLMMDEDELPVIGWREYEQMTEEHRQMMMEQDEPFIEGVEENE